MNPTPHHESAAPRDTRKRRQLASIAATVGLIIVALGAGFAWHSLRGTDTAPTPPEMTWNDPAALKPTLHQQTAAKVAALQFTKPDGTVVRLGDYKGKVVVLNFWATWCPPCIKEMPDLDAIAQALAPRNGVVLVASLNATSAEAGDWLAANNLNHVQLLMDMGGKQFATMPNAGLPLTLLINRDGTLAERLDGYQKWREEDLRRKLSTFSAQ